MSACHCLTRELAERGLQPNERLLAELRTLCTDPSQGLRVLWQRLNRGARVLDLHGGEQAPDHLWDRWEAIFAAWWCCEQEMEARITAAQKRRMRRTAQPPRRITTPRFDWN